MAGNIHPGFRLFRRQFLGFIFLLILLSIPPLTQAASPPLVISQIYGGGGAPGAFYRVDYIELFNAGEAPIGLNGWSIQYAGATSSAWSSHITPLSDVTLQPGQYYLIHAGGAGTEGSPLPTADLTTELGINATDGKVALVNSLVPLSTKNPIGDPSIIDFVGYGSTAQGFEGAAAAPSPDSGSAIFRADSGCTDNNDNALDFSVSTPIPRNTSSAFNPCSGTPPGDEDSTPPEVVSTQPTTNATDIAQDAMISITFSEDVLVNAVWFAISCVEGGSITATVDGGPRTYTLYPTTNYQPNDTCTVNVFSARVEDSAGNTMTENFTWSFAIGEGDGGDPPDNRPTVTGTTPANGATNIPIETSIIISFNEAVTFNPTGYLIECAVSGTVTAVLSGGPIQYTLTPETAFAPNETCTVTISAAAVIDTDAPLQAMENDFIFNFTTEPPPTPPTNDPPTVSEITPRPSDPPVALDTPITVTFTELVNLASPWYTLTCDGATIAADQAIADAVVTLTPQSTLPASATCTITIIATQVTDADGTPMAENFSQDFSTLGITDVPPRVVTTFPASGAVDVELTVDPTISFNEDVQFDTTAWFTITCASSGSVTATATGGPRNFTLNTAVDFADGERCTIVILADQVADLDDVSDNMSNNYAWSFTIRPDATADFAPTVTSTLPTNEAVDVPVDTDLQVTFSEEVTIGSNWYGITCTVTGTVSATTTGGPRLYTLNPTVNLAPGETCTVTLTATQINDTDGAPTPLATDYIWRFTTIAPPDTAPTVTAVTPADGATDVNTNSNLVVTFSEPVALASDAITLGCAAPEAFTRSGSDTEIIINPTNLLPTDTTCTLTISAAGVTDKDGDSAQAMAVDFVTTFTTISSSVADVPPFVASTTPSDGAQNIGVDAAISITFSEDVLTSGEWFTIRCDDVSQTARASGGVMTFTLQPNTPLPEGAVCIVRVIATQIRDLDGDTDNVMTTDYLWSFTTIGGTDDGETVPPAVTTVAPVNGASNVPVNDAVIRVTFTKAVSVSPGWFGLSCTLSGNVPATVSSSAPTVFNITPDNTLTFGETCTVTLFAAFITDTSTPPVNMAADYSWQFTTEAAPETCTDPYTRIHTIQGSGAQSTMISEEVITQGFITVEPNYIDGFYLQDPLPDADPNTSEGVLIQTALGGAWRSGDTVRVRGTVREIDEETRLTDIAYVILCPDGETGVAPQSLNLPFSADDNLERYEGMWLSFPQELTITDNRNIARSNSFTISADGRRYQPTQITTPGASAVSQQTANDLNALLVDDGFSELYTSPPAFLHPDGAFPRVGDSTIGLTGILRDWRGTYALVPNAAPTFVRRDPRPEVPPSTDGRLRVVTFNLQNYFNAPFPSERGADSAEAFARQRSKLINAILQMDAHIFGLVELENDLSVEGILTAQQDLVNGLNEIAGEGAYTLIDTGTRLGEEPIRVGLIYRPAFVTPFNTWATTSAAPFDGRRPPLAQTFTENSTGSRFTVVVSHFKSKGCGSAAGDNAAQGDGQGCWNTERTQASQALLTWLAGDPTASGDTDFLIIGDLNAYAQEDPLQTLISAGYTDLINRYEGETAYTYIFDGQSGYLDHALASASLAPQVTDTSIWHINASEPPALDYRYSNIAEAERSRVDGSPYRSSDHDPVIVGLNLRAPAPTDLPTTLEWLAPTGTITTPQGNPVYQWNRVQGATEYQLYVLNADTNTVIVDEIVADAAVCSERICSVDVTTLSEAYRLINGNYAVYARVWQGTAPGLWNGPFGFTLNAPAPTSVDLLPLTGTTSSRPTFRWSLPEDANAAVWFRVYLASTADLNTALLDQWLHRPAVCDATSSCTFTLPVDLSNGTYGLYMGSWGPGGFSIGENNGYAALNLNVNLPTPETPTNVTVETQFGHPVIAWNAVANAAWYRISITDSVGTKLFEAWTYNDVCIDGRCTFVPEFYPSNGTYIVNVGTWGSGGFGGNADAAPYVLSTGVAGTATDLATASENTGTPLLSWSHVTDASWYEVRVLDATSTVVYSGWHLADDLGCTPICAVQPEIYLANGSYTWSVTAWSPGGMGTAATGPALTVNAPAATPPPLQAPGGVTNKRNPIFTWGHQDAVTWYQITIETPDDGAIVYQGWHAAIALACSSAGQCTLQVTGMTLPNANYAWSVVGYTPAGVGGASAKQVFTVFR